MDLATLANDIASAYTPPTGQGRPAAIGNADTVQELLTYIQDGNYPEVAAELAGVSLRTLQNWIKRGEDGEAPFDAFMRAVKRASAMAEHVEMGKVRKAGADPRFWAASMTYLERRHPERWARRSEGSDGPKVVVQIGVRDSDVQVQVQVQSAPEQPAIDTLACSTEQVSPDLHRLTEARESDK
jgi:hypothetical protein